MDPDDDSVQERAETALEIDGGEMGRVSFPDVGGLARPFPKRNWPNHVKKGVFLDLGCDPGHWAAAAIEAGMTTVGCDRAMSRGALQVRELHSRFILVQANGECLSMRNGSFDIALCELVLPYVNIEACMKEISRVLKTGGIVHGVCHGPGYYLMQVFSEFKELYTNALRRIASYAIRSFIGFSGFRTTCMRPFKQRDEFDIL
jgi:ubiquinone/menaquinone biosynthesis C-methylase UbiE